MNGQPRTSRLHDSGLRCRVRKLLGIGKAEFWNGIRVKNSQARQRLKERFGRVQLTRFVRPMWPSDKLCASASGNVFLEDPIRVVEVRNDQGKTPKIMAERLRKNAAA